MSTDEAPWTIKRLLSWTTDYLTQHGSDSPRLDAEVLLANARNCQRIELYTAADEVPAEPVLKQYREQVRLRSGGTPVAYLVGHKEFFSLSFQVTPAVLIPRPETEFVLVALLDKVKEDFSKKKSIQIADIGTGSGVLAICSAIHLPNAVVTATDVSEEALQVASANAGEYKMDERIQFVTSDLLSNVFDPDIFDVIVTNPPYVTEPEWNELAPGVRDYEPKQALVGGPTGIEIIERIFGEATQRLRVGGWIFCEISPMICKQVEQLVRGQAHFDTVEIVKDLAQHPRVIVAHRC